MELKEKLTDFSLIFDDDIKDIALREYKDFWEVRHDIWFKTLKPHGFSEEEIKNLEIYLDSTDPVYGSLIDDLNSEVSDETINKFMKLDLSTIEKTEE